MGTAARPPQDSTGPTLGPMGPTDLPVVRVLHVHYCQTPPPAESTGPILELNLSVRGMHRQTHTCQ